MGFARIGLRNDEPLLLSIFDKAIAAITDDERARITNRWLGLKLPSAPADFRTRVNLTPEEQAWLAKKQTIHVQYWQHPPYFYLKDGKVVGVSVDLLNAVAEKTGVTFQYENRLDRFADVLQGLKERKKPDVVAAIMPTPEREKVILFTEPYINSPRFIFTRDDTPFVSSIKQLFGKKVAVVKDYATHKTLIDMFPEVDLLVYNNNEAALRAVSSGEAVAFIGDLVSTPAMINEFGLKNLKAVSPSSLPDHPLAMGVRNDWPELQSILDKGLAAIPQADKAAIINKWSSVKFDYGIHPKDVITWVLIVAIAVSGIILLFVLWNKSLKKKVRQRTDDLTAEINERKQAEEATRISEKRFKQVADNAQEWVWEVDSKGLYTYSSPIVEKLLGYRPEELVGRKHFYDLFCAEEREAHKAAALSIFHQKQSFTSFENLNVHKSGKLVWLSTSGTPVLNRQGELCGYRGSDTDITERKYAVQALAKSESKYRDLVDNSLIGIFITDLTGQFIFVNDAMVQMYDFDSIEQMLNTTTRTIWTNIDDRKHMLQLLNEHGRVDNFEGRTTTPTGRIVHVLFSATLRDGLITGMVMDISERRQAEDALLESEEKFRTLVTNTEEIVYMIDKDGIFLLSEGKGLAKLGLKPGQVVGKSVSELYKDYPDMLDEMRRALNGETITSEVNIDGNYFRNWYTPHKNNEGKTIGLLGLSVNITEQKQAENRLQEYQQRLKSLAVQLTFAEEQERRHIAENLHDNVGQSLAFARMQLAAARKGLPKNDKRDAQFDGMSQSLLQAIQDTRHLIFELSSPTLSELGLAAAISDWMDVQIVNKHGIKVELFDHAQDVPLDADLRAILFRNVRELLSNAIKHAQAKTISVWLENTADGLEITIQDDGVGFDTGAYWRSNDADRGFGLFSIQEHMTDLGGKLIITSQPGAGCKAVLVLPIQQQKQEI